MRSFHPSTSTLIFARASLSSAPQVDSSFRPLPSYALSSIILSANVSQSRQVGKAPLVASFSNASNILLCSFKVFPCSPIILFCSSIKPIKRLNFGARSSLAAIVRVSFEELVEVFRLRMLRDGENRQRRGFWGSEDDGGRRKTLREMGSGCTEATCSCLSIALSVCKENQPMKIFAGHCIRTSARSRDSCSQRSKSTQWHSWTNETALLKVPRLDNAELSAMALSIPNDWIRREDEYPGVLDQIEEVGSMMSDRC